MRFALTALAVVAAFAFGVYVGNRADSEPSAPPAGGVWLADGRAGQVRSDERQWANCGVAVRPDLSDELVVCKPNGGYQCYSPGDSTDPDTWALLQWNARCSRARDSLRAKRLIMNLG